MEKDFKTWNSLKQRLDKSTRFKRPKRGEIWWVSVGVNIGTEIYGKGKSFTRPVLVINAENQESFIGIPLTSSLKQSKYARIIKTADGKLSTALVSQIRNFDKRRLLSRHSILSDEEYKNLSEVFTLLFKI